MKIGVNINRFLEQKGLTLESLTESTTIGIEQIQLILNDVITPSLSAVTEIARALGITVQILVDGNESQDIMVVKADEGVEYNHPCYSNDTTKCYMLAPQKVVRAMEPCKLTITASQGASISPASAEGEEFFYILDGEVEVTIGDKKVSMVKGESLYIDSLLPHCLASKSEKSEILVVSYSLF